MTPEKGIVLGAAGLVAGVVNSLAGVAERFQRWPQAAIVYFGVLVSPCKVMMEEPEAHVLVVPDHKLGTNDCRGWIRRSVFQRLKEKHDREILSVQIERLRRERLGKVSGADLDEQPQSALLEDAKRRLPGNVLRKGASISSAWPSLIPRRKAHSKAVGIFVLYPTNEFVYYYEYQPGNSTAADFAVTQLHRSIKGQTPEKTTFYAIVGMILSVSGALLYSTMQRRSQRIEQLSAALQSDLRTLIAQGESAQLEFKSSFRWDLRENKVNRALEAVVLKTLAGYMNGNGGTLLIGVADDGAIVGLEHDYKTLKKQDRDGFEQAVMTAVATKLGGDACRCVQIVFHSVENQEVCRVMVAPTPRPVYVKEGDAPKLYVRTGVSTRELNVQEAVDYTSARWPK